MKYKLLVGLVSCALVVSCTPTTATPTPTLSPQVAVVTRIIIATPQIVIVTATPEPTNTPTITPTPTDSLSPTIAPTETRVPSPTATPKEEITRGTPYFNDSFNTESPAKGFGWTTEFGAKVEYVPDPTDPSKKVMRVVITDKPVFNPTPNYKPANQYWINGATSWRNTDHVPVNSIETDLYLPASWTGGGSILSTHSSDLNQVTAFELTDTQQVVTYVLISDATGKLVPNSIYGFV